MRRRLEQAKTELQFQSVGHIGREVLITLAQEVFDPSRHRSVDGVEPSRTDAKRMLEAYIATELAGPAQEAARRHARAALDVSNELQHRRTAAFRDAALCAEATTSVVNLVAIISGRRDP
jgi:tryptophan 2,3-dioxygenase